ncbi:unnamed protein product [Ectocarpus sp. 12 AP-2014]
MLPVQSGRDPVEAPPAGDTTGETLARPPQGRQDGAEMANPQTTASPVAFTASRNQAAVRAPFAPTTQGRQDGAALIDSNFAVPTGEARTSPDPVDIATARIRIRTFYNYRRVDEPVHEFIRVAELEVATYDQMQRQRTSGAQPPIPAMTTGGGIGHACAESQGAVHSAMQEDGGRPCGYTPAAHDIQLAATRTTASSILPTHPPAGSVTQHAHLGFSDQGPPPPPELGDQRLSCTHSLHVHHQRPPFPPGIPPTFAVHHPNRTATQFNEGVEDLLNTLAGRVLARWPTVGYMRTTIAAYSDLKRLAPGGGALVHILAVARVSNRSAKTFERNMNLLGKVGTVLNEADFFKTAKRVKAGLDAAGPAAGNAAGPPAASAAAMGSGSSAGT